ncbi:hypothetical protein CTheo_2642 [Ceratobasidium theobromae]|uniref:Arrestin-like N-terminal domain-containing protein n=1 Tax=Ceratobasidium theobromae TaxID=1582974 RepID=A0A5N5QRW9_9AGAM|nr:hypothetical protein CTheo_2642 [Ceratobasidium theobromae]
MMAPSYIDSGHSTLTSPPYTPSLTDGEQTLELGSSSSSLPTDLPSQYIFQSKRLRLDLGARTWPTRTPCYGYASNIQGIVSVTTLEHVKQITLTLEAVAKSLFMPAESAVPAGRAENTLLQRTAILYAATYPRPSNPGANYGFSIELPTTCDKSTDPLPPSFTYHLPGVSAEVRYHLRIEISRSGLRRRESLVVPIFYLPRSYAPLRLHNTPFLDERTIRPPQDDEMREFHLTPKPLSKYANIYKTPPPQSLDIQAKIALPFPLIFASGDRIPFTITIHSQSPALTALYTDITLQLIKVVKLKAYDKSLLKEIVISSGEVYDSEQLRAGEHVLHGELGSGAPGTELSWSADNIINVGYLVRLSISPPHCMSALSANIPMFMGIPVEIVTHLDAADSEPSAPELGLLGTGSPAVFILSPLRVRL